MASETLYQELAGLPFRAELSERDTRSLTFDTKAFIMCKMIERVKPEAKLCGIYYSCSQTVLPKKVTAREGEYTYEDYQESMCKGVLVELRRLGGDPGEITPGQIRDSKEAFMSVFRQLKRLCDETPVEASAPRNESSIGKKSTPEGQGPNERVTGSKARAPKDLPPNERIGSTGLEDIEVFDSSEPRAGLRASGRSDRRLKHTGMSAARDDCLEERPSARTETNIPSRAKREAPRSLRAPALQADLAAEGRDMKTVTGASKVPKPPKPPKPSKPFEAPETPRTSESPKAPSQTKSRTSSAASSVNKSMRNPRMDSPPAGRPRPGLGALAKAVLAETRVEIGKYLSVTQLPAQIADLQRQGNGFLHISAFRLNMLKCQVVTLETALLAHKAALDEYRERGDSMTRACVSLDASCANLLDPGEGQDAGIDLETRSRLEHCRNCCKTWLDAAEPTFDEYRAEDYSVTPERRKTDNSVTKHVEENATAVLGVCEEISGMLPLIRKELEAAKIFGKEGSQSDLLTSFESSLAILQYYVYKMLHAEVCEGKSTNSPSGESSEVRDGGNVPQTFDSIISEFEWPTVSLARTHSMKPLGNLQPRIGVPGPWSSRRLRPLRRQLAQMPSDPTPDGKDAGDRPF